MIHTDQTDYLKQVEAFAEKVGLREQLDEKLKYLGGYAGGVNTRCTLYKDFAPASFEFVMERRDCVHTPWKRWFNGGLIYHGPHDGFGSGGAPTFSVSLSPEHGWQIHT
jgi:hypothetical protein